MKKADGANKRLLATAYHEAGHAIASFWLRVPIKRISIEPDPGKGSIGHVAHFGWNLGTSFAEIESGEIPPRVRDKIENQVIVFLAGGFAAKRFTGCWNNAGISSDRQSAIELAQRVAGWGKTFAPYWKWLWLRPGFWVSRHI